MCENLENDEKIRLFEGQGSWNTFDSDGKLNSITMSDGPHGLRRQKESNVSNINESNIATCFPTARLQSRVLLIQKFLNMLRNS